MVTTIGRGEFLDDYHAAVNEERCADRVEFIVIPDRKSPAELFEKCKQHASRGLKVRCPTLEEQDHYLAKLNLADFVPYNSDNRRNIGYLMALESGRDFTISIDDDNYARPGSKFFEEHAVVTRERVELPVVNSSNGWFNICKLMQVDPPNVYPRGFPYHKRHEHAEITETTTTSRVKLNAGLWLGEPDLDAMTWLVSPARSTSLSGKPGVLLGERAWSPINTQNTSLHRDLLVTYYFAKMGYPLAGLVAIDRYGDILSGYLCQAVVRHMRDGIRVGTPAVDHRRNSHNYMRDATHEMGCVWLMEDLTTWLSELKLEGTAYADAYLSLASQLDDAAEKFNGYIWNEATRGYVHQLAYCMRRWTAACTRWL